MKVKPFDSGELANHQIVTLAVWLCGGDINPVDTEDVAVKAHELAPGRFSWRKYPEQINIDTVRKRLWDARKEQNGSCVTGSERQGWQLTKAGVSYAQRQLRSKLPSLSRSRLSLKEKQIRKSEKSRMLASSAFGKFAEGRLEDVSISEAEAFFRIDDYVKGESRQRKLRTAINMFSGDQEIGRAVKAFASLVRA